MILKYRFINLPVLMIAAACVLSACSTPGGSAGSVKRADSSIVNTPDPVAKADSDLVIPEIRVVSDTTILPRKLIHIDSVNSARKVQRIKGWPADLLGNIDTMTIREADRFVIRLYTVEAGPLVVPETHGIYYNVLISVTEYGEYEPSHVFSVGPFLGPRFKPGGTDLKDRYIVNVKHGYPGEKDVSLVVYLDRVVVE